MILGVVVVMTLLSSCSAEEPPVHGSSEQWLVDTAALLRAPLSIGADGVAISLPSTGGQDVYSMAQAISSFGEQIDQLPPETLASAKKQFHEAIEGDKLEETVGGTLYAIAEFLRADATAHVLSASDKDDLLNTMDVGLPTLLGRDPDVVDSYMFAQVAAAYPEADLGTTSDSQSVADATTGLCSVDPDPWLFLFAAATPGVALPCGDAELVSLWSDALESLHASLEGDGDVGVSECGQLRPLSEIWALNWADDSALKEQLMESFALAAERVTAERLQDPLVCLSDLRSVATLLEVPQIPLTERQSSYLAMVVRGGGNPVEYQLSSDGLASIVAVNRIANGAPLDLRAATALADAELLSIAVAADEPWTDSHAALVESVARSSREPGTARLVLSGLLLGGDTACDLPENSASMQLAQTTAVSNGEDPVARAYAAALEERCSGDVDEAYEKQALGAAEDILNAEDLDPVLSVWEASAIYCALAPESLLDPKTIWAGAESSAGDFGGVELSPGEISFPRTQKLFELLTSNANDCTQRGVLGYPA